MAMTQASGAASPAPPSDRLRSTSLTSRLLARPSAGALLITVFVWIVFAVLSTLAGGGVFYSIEGTLNYLDVAAQVGIVGDGRRAADDRRRVRPLGRLAHRLRRDRHRHLRDDVRAAGLARDPHLDGR